MNKKDKLELKLVLGTAQLDTSSKNRYGTCNKSILTDDDTNSLLDRADYLKIDRLDTASAYGNVYTHLSKFYEQDVRLIQISSKISSMDWVTKDTHVDVIKANIMKDHQLVKDTNYLYSLSFHSYDDYLKQNCYQALLELKKEGYVEKIGVSVYYYWQTVKVIYDPDYDYLQVPFNLLSPFDLGDMIKERNQRYPDNPLIVDVRSIFLQGILLNHNYQYWKQIHGLDQNRFENIISLLNKFKDESNSESLIELIFSYLKSFSWINGVIIGVDNQEQLESNVSVFESAKKIKASILNKYRHEFKNITNYSPRILDPTTWKKESSKWW